jgi:GNAT superfamily N-acetyltransferase
VVSEPGGSQTIRPVRVEEAALLHALTQRSTMHWGYEPEFLEWEPESIAVTPAFLEKALASYALEEDSVVTGYYTLTGTAAHAHLDKLFVDAPFIGTGRGKLLWHHAIATARWLNVQQLDFYADPNAASFYRAMGAVWISEEETSRPGWNLQFFKVDLER